MAVYQALMLAFTVTSVFTSVIFGTISILLVLTTRKK